MAAGLGVLPGTSLAGCIHEGCTPGYWKNRGARTSQWSEIGYSPNRRVDDVFDLAVSDDSTLFEALGGGGGPGIEGAQTILLRAAVAALLNDAHPDVDFNYESRTGSTIVEDVNSALASGDRSTIIELAERLDSFNNSGCSI